MPKPKWSAFQESKEYQLWLNIETICNEYDLSGNNYVTRADVGGVFWEPLFEKIFKLGVTLKHVPKAIKEIKHDWMRPLLYLESQSQEKVQYDGVTYLVDKGAIGLTTTLRFAFKRFLDSLVIGSTLNEENFVKEVKTMKENSKYFFKSLNAYVKEGYRAMHENIKLILKPLRMLRKSGYRLFSLEKLEDNNIDLTMFKDPNSLGIFMNGIKEHFQWEEFKTKRDVDEEKFKEFLDKNYKQDPLRYHFNDEKREEEVQPQNPYDSIAKKNIEGVSSSSTTAKQQQGDKTTNPKVVVEKLTPEEKFKLKEQKEIYKLIHPNINNLIQKEPTRFMHDALQSQFEDGILAMIIYLNDKQNEKFPEIIDTRKIFININKIPNSDKHPAISYYVNQLQKEIYQLKVKCYEMKLNGLSRVLLPITANVEFIDIIKKVYDLHLIVDALMGNTLKLEQYLFIYDIVKYIIESNLKDEIEKIKSKDFMEKGIGKYIVFTFLCESVKCFGKMVAECKKKGKKISNDDYFQLSKLGLQSKENKNDVLYYNYNFTKKVKTFTEEQLTLKKTYEHEVKTYGRFWKLENYINPQEKQQWIDMIEQLLNINELVRDDIKNYFLLSTLPKYMEDLSNTQSRKSTVKGLPVGTQSKNASRTNSRVASRAGSPKRRLSKKQSASRIKTPKGKLGNNNVGRKRSDSFMSEDTIEKNKLLNTNIDNLKPPHVWNFPVDRVKKMQEEMSNEMKSAKKKDKDINIKNEIKIESDPKDSYVDGRVNKFIDTFNVLFDNMMNYCKNERNDSWEFIIDKVLTVLNIRYQPYKRFDNLVYIDLVNSVLDEDTVEKYKKIISQP